MAANRLVGPPDVIRAKADTILGLLELLDGYSAVIRESCDDARNYPDDSLESRRAYHDAARMLRVTMRELAKVL